MTSIIHDKRQRKGRQPKKPGDKVAIICWSCRRWQISGKFCEGEIAEVLTKNVARTAKIQLDGWHLLCEEYSARRNIPLSPELAKLQTNEDGTRQACLSLFLSYESFWMNDQSIIGIGFLMIWRIIQISKGVVHLHNSSVHTQLHSINAYHFIIRGQLSSQARQSDKNFPEWSPYTFKELVKGIWQQKSTSHNLFSDEVLTLF